MAADKVIDVTGKVCPFPLITLAKEVRNMRRGQTLCIIGNDPIFEETMIDFCREGSHEVLEISRDGKKVTFTVTIQQGNKSP